MPVEQLSFLVVEDNDVLRRVWRQTFATKSVRVHTAESISEAKAIMVKYRFSALVLDLYLPDGLGTDLLPMVQTMLPRPKVVIISGYIVGDSVIDLVHQCDAVLPKPVTPDKLRKLLFSLTTQAVRNDPLTLFCSQGLLSPREIEVVRAAVEGMQNKRTADHLGCAPSTVISHWKRIFHKTGCSSRLEVLASIIRLHASATDGQDAHH